MSPSEPRHPCAICGKRSRAADMVYSRFTGNRYCIAEAACRKRAARRAKSVALDKSVT